MRTITPDDLRAILGSHADYLRGDPKGQRADLSYADLSYADLGAARGSNAGTVGAARIIRRGP